MNGVPIPVLVIIGLAGLVLGGTVVDPGKRRVVVSAPMTGLAFVALTLRFGLAAELPAYLYLAMVAVALASMDFDLRRLTDRLLFPSYIVAVALLMPAGVMHGDVAAPERCLFGAVAIAVPVALMRIALPKAIHAGDVALAGLLGMYLGWLTWSAVLVGLAMLILLVGARASRVTVGGGTLVTVAPCLVAAATLSLFTAAPLLSTYLSALS